MSNVNELLAGYLDNKIILCEAKKEPGVTKLYLHGDIYDDDFEAGQNTTDDKPTYITPALVRELLANVGNDKIELHLNTYGGSFFAAIAIYNHLNSLPNRIETHVDALVASGGSIIAMAGDTIYMPANTLMFIHRAWGVAVGNVDAMEKKASILRKLDDGIVELLKKRFKGTESELKNLLSAETWLTAPEAVEFGLADVLIGGESKAPKQARMKAKNYKKSDQAILAFVEAALKNIGK